MLRTAATRSWLQAPIGIPASFSPARPPPQILSRCLGDTYGQEAGGERALRLRRSTLGLEVMIEGQAGPLGMAIEGELLLQYDFGTIDDILVGKRYFQNSYFSFFNWKKGI